MTEFELIVANRVLCGPDFCHVCSRPTDHFGEHDDAQLEARIARGGMMRAVFDRTLQEENNRRERERAAFAQLRKLEDEPA